MREERGLCAELLRLSGQKDKKDWIDGGSLCLKSRIYPRVVGGPLPFCSRWVIRSLLIVERECLPVGHLLIRKVDKCGNQACQNGHNVTHPEVCTTLMHTLRYMPGYPPLRYMPGYPPGVWEGCLLHTLGIPWWESYTLVYTLVGELYLVYIPPLYHPGYTRPPPYHSRTCTAVHRDGQCRMTRPWAHLWE